MPSPLADPEYRRARARHANLSRYRPPDDPDLAAAAARLRELQATQAVREIVDRLPPLSAEARARLATLLLSER